MAAGLAYAAPRVPWAGALTGELVSRAASRGTGCGRRASRSGSPTRWPRWPAQGVTVFVEIGPDGTLSALGPAALATTATAGAVFVPVLRPGQAAPRRR